MNEYLNICPDRALLNAFRPESDHAGHDSFGITEANTYCEGCDVDAPRVRTLAEREGVR